MGHPGKPQHAARRSHQREAAASGTNCPSRVSGHHPPGPEDRPAGHPVLPGADPVGQPPAYAGMTEMPAALPVHYDTMTDAGRWARRQPAGLQIDLI